MQAADHYLHDVEPEVQELDELHVDVPIAETGVEYDDPKQDDEYEEGILGEEFNDSEYELEENIAVVDNDENTYFKLSEGFDIGVRDE